MDHNYIIWLQLLNHSEEAPKRLPTIQSLVLVLTVLFYYSFSYASAQLLSITHLQAEQLRNLIASA